MVKVPKDVDPVTVAPLLCAGVTVFNGMRQMGIPPGEIVGIQGLGGLGHLALQYANKMGYRVVALSSSGSKEKFARDLGAHDYVDGSKTNEGEYLKNLGGAAMIVSTAPNPEVIPQLLEGLAPLGKLLILSGKLPLTCNFQMTKSNGLSAAGDITINTGILLQKGLGVHSWPSGHALDSEEAINFAQIHGVKCMVEKFPFTEVQKAYEHMKSGKARFRAVITM